MKLSDDIYVRSSKDLNRVILELARYKQQTRKKGKQYKLRVLNVDTCFEPIADELMIEFIALAKRDLSETTWKFIIDDDNLAFDADNFYFIPETRYYKSDGRTGIIGNNNSNMIPPDLLQILIKMNKRCKVYRNYPLLATKHSVILILSKWRDSNLNCFPRDIIKIICKLSIKF